MSDAAENQGNSDKMHSELSALRSEVTRLAKTVDALTIELHRLVRVTAQATAQRQVEQTDSIVVVHRLDGGGMEIRVRDTAEQTQATKQALEESLAIREQAWMEGYG